MSDEYYIAIISAAAALSGVVISQLISLTQDFLNRKNQRRQLLREKYEDLLNHLNESISFSTTIMSSKTIEELTFNSQPISARRIYGLTLLYFPRLTNHSAEYLESSIMFQHAISDGFKYIENTSAGAQALVHNKSATLAANEAQNRARHALDMEIKKCATEYVNA